MGRDGKVTASTPAPEPTVEPEPIVEQPPPPDEAPGSPGQVEEEPIVEDPGAEDAAGAVFDLEAFVRSLPAGVCLCPSCLGMGAVVEAPPFDPHTHRCEACQGHGRTRTGSQVADQAERPCLDCQGRGFVDNAAGAPPASPARPEDFEVGVPRDHRGRTPDDPAFDWSRVVHDPGAVAAPEPAPVG